MASEALTRAVELADHLSFRRVAHRYLSLRGYREPKITDGRSDGGADLLVRTLGGNETPLAIAISTQAKDLASKVRDDCLKAQRVLKLEEVLFLSSRRLANADMADVVDELRREHNIRVRTVDSQEIATVFADESEGAFLLETVGIGPDERRPDAVDRPSFREEAAYSFALFGDASQDFRSSVVEQTVLAYLVDQGSTPREDLEAAVADALQLAGDQVLIISGGVDRMLQQQRVHIESGNVDVDPVIADEFGTARALRERQWNVLKRDVDHLLGESGLLGQRLERASDAILGRAGALVMQSAMAAGGAIAISAEQWPLRLQVRKRLREIAADLGAAGMAPEAAARCQEAVADMIANSDIGHILMAGELFLGLTSMDTNEFERAFGAGGSEIYLDASVAIPMIISLLYEPAESRFSRAALRIYDMAKARGIPLLLPEVYLEEAAAHLVEARDWYPPLIDDPALRFSTNAYVAHYMDLATRGRLETKFEAYADNLGYVPRTGSPRRQVEGIADRLRATFERYGISVIPLESPDAESLKVAQEAITFTAHDQKLTRHGRLLAHDASVVAHFMQSDAPQDVVRIFCTWDRLHLRLKTSEGQARWQPLDPVMLGDVIVLSRPESREELLTTLDVALELTEEDGRRAADVLDDLVRIEKDRLYDADLMTLARNFKEAFLQARRDGVTQEVFAELWSAWKGGERELAQQTRLPIDA